MLPDADVDIDDLVDDADDDDGEAEIAAEDLTTDEEEEHPTSSSSSPTSTERVNGEPSVADTAAASEDAADADDSPSDELDVANSTTSELAESQASITELQSNEPKHHQQQQQQPSIDTDDIKLDTDNTGTLCVDLPEPSPTADELPSEDSSKQKDVEEEESQEESLEDKDCTNTFPEDEQEAGHEDNDKVQVNSSDTRDANQQVCQSPTADVIPPTSSSVSTSSSPTSLEPPQHTEFVSEPQNELQLVSEDKEEKGEQNDMKYVPETGDQSQTEQHDHIVADQSEQNDLEIDNESQLEVQADHEPQSSTAQTNEEQSTCVTEKQEQPVHVETAVDLEKRSLSNADDEVTSQQGTDACHEDVTVTEVPTVTEEVPTVTDEVKYEYEATAKQLDLLGRLAMLKEKAAQRKAQQTTDTGSTEDSQETSSSEGHGPSRHSDDSTRLPDEKDSAQQQQKVDATDAVTKTDASGTAMDTNTTDKDTLSETDKQTVLATINADAKQSIDVIGSPTHGAGMTEDNSVRGKLVSTTNEGHCCSTGSPSTASHDDKVETKAPTQTTDNKLVSTAENTSLSTTDKSTMKTVSKVELEGTSTAEVVKDQPETTHSVSDSANTSTKGAATVNMQSEPAERGSNVTCTDTRKLADEFKVRGDSTATDSAVKLQPADQPGHAQALSGTTSVKRELPGATTAANSIAPLEPVHGGSDNSTESAAPTEKLTDTDSALSRTAGAVAKHSQPSDGSSDHGRSPQLEHTKALSDTADGKLSNTATATPASTVSHEPTKSSGETTSPPDDSGDAAVNYDSDLDPELAQADSLHLLSAVQTLKVNNTDGPGYLYVLADRTRKRFKIAASRSPAKRLRQATAFNPDITSLVCLSVSRRLAAVAELRRRLTAGKHSGDVIAAGSRDWFTGSDDAVTKLVRQVAASDATDN